MDYCKLVVLINKYKLNKEIKKWAGMFRYLGACHEKDGFSLEEWINYNNTYIDIGIVKSLFRILKENHLIVEKNNRYYITNDNELQRYFEVIYEITKTNLNVSDNNRVQGLLWTPPSEKFIPQNISENFKYLNTWIQKLIQITEEKIIFFSPYYTVSGMKKLLTSIEFLIKNRRKAILFFITNDISINSNKKAFKFLFNKVKKYNSDNIRVFQGKNSHRNDGFKFHAKLLLVDNKRGYMGSANFSKVALENGFELGIPLQEEQVISLTNLIDYWINNNILKEVKFNEIDNL